MCSCLFIFCAHHRHHDGHHVPPSLSPYFLSFPFAILFDVRPVSSACCTTVLVIGRISVCLLQMKRRRRREIIIIESEGKKERKKRRRHSLYTISWPAVSVWERAADEKLTAKKKVGRKGNIFSQRERFSCKNGQCRQEWEKRRS